MKKHLLVILACAAAISVYGCSSQTSKPTDAASAESTESTQAPESQEETTKAPAEDVTTVDGIVVDATMNTLTIQSPETGVVSFDTSSVNENDLADGLLIGNAVSVSYEGDLDGAIVTELADSKKEPKLNQEQLQFAAEIMAAVNAKNLNQLTSLCSSPVYVDLDGGMTFAEASELADMDPNAILPDKLVESVTTTDLFTAEAVEAGVVLGSDPAYNITFQADESGKLLGITGINYGDDYAVEESME